MRRKILLFIFIIMLTLTGIVNVSAKDEYEGELTIEYLLRNYNVVTLGTKDVYNGNSYDIPNGSVTNVFDIGGPVLIRGNYTGTETLENEFAQKTNGIPSYINGYIGASIKPGSIESAEISNIYVSNKNTVYTSGDVYVVNKTKYNYKYPVYRTDDYINFDTLYAAIVNEQRNISYGNSLVVNDPTLLLTYKDYLNSSINKYIINEPGNYNYSSNYKIYIFDYDPNETYIISYGSNYVSMPEIEIRYPDGTLYKSDSDSVYCGRKDASENCAGNIIWSFPNARQIYVNKPTIGHIIAPKADVKLSETHYAGTIIANSVASDENKKTAIQFYPYNIDKTFTKAQGSLCVTETVYESDSDNYSGNYTLDELLKNYSVVSLGQNAYSPNTKLSEYNVPNGTVNIFHMAGGFLINGNLGLEGVEFSPKSDAELNGIKADFRYTDSNYANSYLKGGLGNNLYLVTGYHKGYSIRGVRKYVDTGYSSSYLSNSRLWINSNIQRYVNNIDDAQGALHYKDTFEERDFDYDPDTYKLITKIKTYQVYDNADYFQDASSNKFIRLPWNITAGSNFMNFETLYKSIVYQQKNISKGNKLTKSSNGDLIIPVGGNYYIDNLDDVKNIRFSNWSNNKNVLTVITITDPNVINFPILYNESGGLVSTNDWNGRYATRTYPWITGCVANIGYKGACAGYITEKDKEFLNGAYLYPGETLVEDQYYGNIVWNIPNANYIKLPSAPFFGHIIAPNADVETPELHFAGTMIVNSLYTEGNSEAHFYPLTIGSVGSGGLTYQYENIGECDTSKVDISGTINWKGDNNSIPESVTVRLFANGKEVDSIKVTASNNWQYVFSNKPKLSNGGTKISYTVKMDKVENYSSTVSGYNITNTYQPKVEKLSLEYLLRNYNIVSLGTKDYFAHSEFNNKDLVKGSVTNIYDVGGPVLIRGNFKSSDKYENEFAQKTNGIPSFILGKLGDNITPGSKEYTDPSDIYVGSKNTVYKSGNGYQVNNTSFKYDYPVYRSDEYLGFDSLYATIVTEQSTIDEGNELLINDPTLLMQYNEYLDTSKSNIIITEPGNYNYSNSSVNKIYIFNYDPNEVYIINNINKYIYEIPEVEIRYSDGRKYDTKSNAVYCGRTDENESCTGNIIWNFKNARYIKSNYSTIGHIIAPNADVELVESHYAGSIIANSVTSLFNSKTAVQFYPYNLDKKLITENGANCITEVEDLDDDIYSGNYSIDELLKNYSIVALGQKALSGNTKLSEYGAPTGTVNIFHIVGSFLINGDLGVKQVEYEAKEIYNDWDYYNDNITSWYYSTNYATSLLYSYYPMNFTYPGIRLDFRFRDYNSANSYLAGKLGSNVYANSTSDYINNAKFYVKSDFKWANKGEAQAVFKKSSWIDRVNPYRDVDPDKYLTNNNKYMLTSKIGYSKVNNFINFTRLYNSIVEQQKKIEKGSVVKPDSSGIVTIPIGGNYTIENIESASVIRFTGYNSTSNSKNLTIVTINDSGNINLPFEETDTYNNSPTSDYGGGVYNGNIVFNIPNATYIKFAENNSFKGHVIAPNADVEMPEMHFAGAMIVNSLNAEGHSEAHFFPLTTGSVGTGMEQKTKVVGVCEIEKTSVSGTITWKNDDISNRPKQMTINLLQDGKKIKEIVVTEADGWKYEVKDLPKTTISGKEIKYTITTNDVLTEYSTLISGYNVINTYKMNDYLNYSIEYLLRNYNVVTLGTQEVYGDIKTDASSGSVTNVFDIGGPVLIRGDYTSTPTYDNEFAQKTNGVPSYIKGTLGKNVTPGSKEYAEKSDIYLGSSNIIHDNGKELVVNDTSFDYDYPVYNDDNYVDFDKLYASVKQDLGNITSNATSISGATPYISTPGKYRLSNTLTKISISNYDPNELYVFEINSTILNKMPEIEIRYSNLNKYETDSDVVYCGRKDSEEDCGGNIIFVFPNARYIKTSYTTTGHIVAPKADIELVESHYPGSIIANSVSAPENKKTSIQFYPYNLNTKLTTYYNSSSCVTETVYSSTNEDIYEGSYSIDELLKNYSIVTLGQKELGQNTKLAMYGAPTGTTNIFHIVGGFLIEGDLGVKNVTFEKRNYEALNGAKLEFRYNNSSYANSFIKGNLSVNAHTIPLSSWPNASYKNSLYVYLGHLSSTRLYLSDNIKKTDEVVDAQSTFNVRILPDFTDTSEGGNFYYDEGKYMQDSETKKFLRYSTNTISTSNDYIDFKTLYNSIVYQQKNISQGQIVTPDSSGVVTIPIGGNYTIENISSAKKIRFTNYSQNRSKLTIVSINDGGSINLPFEETDSYNNTYTNSYYNRNYASSSKEYSGEVVVQENYYGNIVFNIPNATYIKFASGNSFKGHVIAPNADVEMPEMNFAGAMIVNSLNAEGHSEAHFYPLTTGSVGKGSNLSTTRTIGTCEQKEYVSISGKKIWDDNYNQDGVRPTSITLQLLADGKKIRETTLIGGFNNNPNWYYSFNYDALPKKNPLGKDINYVIVEKAVDNYSTSMDGYDIINSYTPKKTSLTVNKVWEDDNDRDGKRPNAIMIQLYANGNPTGMPVELNEENNWMHIFTNLDMYRDAGTRVEYTVKEIFTPYGYTSKETGNQTDGYTITNTHIPEKTTIKINKVWDDNDDYDKIRPKSVMVQLYANDKPVGTPVELNEENNWSYTFEQLYAYENGQKINYTIKENEINGYTNTISGTQQQGYTITNTHVSKKRNFTINIFWEDENNKYGTRPDYFDIQLYDGNGRTVGDPVRLNEENDWSYTITNLDNVDSNGNKINYGYGYSDPTYRLYDGYGTFTQSGFDIYRTLKNKITVTVRKEWVDNKGYKPDSIMVQLYGDDEPIGTPVELSEANYWLYNFNNLDLLNNGNRINYYVREVLTPIEYDVSYKCSNGTYCVIANTPKKMSLTIRKVWDDEENRDNVRPKSVKVQLYNDIYGDGIQVGDPVELNEENNWTYTFNDLRMYSGPVTNKYKLREVDVPEGYTSKITGNQTDGYTITNSYKPNMTTLKINKVWDDKNDKDGIRPDKVMIQLYKDGEPLGEPVEVNKENDWSYEFEDLYMYENGEKVKYTVEMYQEIDGYTYEITGNEEEGYTITNTHIPNENKNPNTLDNIIKFIIISIISLIMLVIGIIIFKKLRKKEV